MRLGLRDASGNVQLGERVPVAGVRMRNLEEIPAYGMVEAAHYLRVPRKTLEYWVEGKSSQPALIQLASVDPPRFSFGNLLECHVLTAIRTHNVKVHRVRRALETLRGKFPSRHPLIDREFLTDGLDLFIQEGGLVNLVRSGQLAMREVLEIYLRRIERDPRIRFFPFVTRKAADEPRIVVIDPQISFGRPVIAGTSIGTAIIASRFEARESIQGLANEYQITPGEIEEAIRWETQPIAA